MKLWGKIKIGASKTWAYLNGKKTVIGSILTAGIMITDGLNPNLMNDKVYNGLLILFGAIFGTGLIHKTTKNETMKKIIHSIKKPTLIFVLALTASCTMPRNYNYKIVDRSNRLIQAADSVSRNDIYRMINYVMVASDYEFEMKISKTLSYYNDTTEQH